MCHRQLKFNKHTECGHLTLFKDSNIDCQDRQCFLSASHPADCRGTTGQTRCACRRYYTQPERLPFAVDGKCERCSK